MGSSVGPYQPLAAAGVPDSARYRWIQIGGNRKQNSGPFPLLLAEFISDAERGRLKKPPEERKKPRTKPGLSQGSRERNYDQSKRSRRHVNRRCRPRQSQNL